MGYSNTDLDVNYRGNDESFKAFESALIYIHLYQRVTFSPWWTTVLGTVRVFGLIAFY